MEKGIRLGVDRQGHDPRAFSLLRLRSAQARCTRASWRKALSIPRVMSDHSCALSAYGILRERTSVKDFSHGSRHGCPLLNSRCLQGLKSIFDELKNSALRECAEEWKGKHKAGVVGRICATSRQGYELRVPWAQRTSV